MQRQIKISYFWKQSSTEAEVLDRHVDFLEETAQGRIFEMLQEGYTSGDLYDNIVACDEDGDGVEYRGSWESESGEVA